MNVLIEMMTTCQGKLSANNSVYLPENAIQNKDFQPVLFWVQSWALHRNHQSEKETCLAAFLAARAQSLSGISES